MRTQYQEILDDLERRARKLGEDEGGMSGRIRDYDALVTALPEQDQDYAKGIRSFVAFCSLLVPGWAEYQPPPGSLSEEFLLKFGPSVCSGWRLALQILKSFLFFFRHFVRVMLHAKQPGNQRDVWLWINQERDCERTRKFADACEESGFSWCHAGITAKHGAVQVAAAHGTRWQRCMVAGKSLLNYIRFLRSLLAMRRTRLLTHPRDPLIAAIFSERILKLLPVAVLDTDLISNWLKHEQLPKLCIFANAQKPGPRSCATLMRGRTRTIEFQHGTYAEAAVFLPLVTDEEWVWGRYTKDYLIEQGCNPDAIHLVGCPFPSTSNAGTTIDKEDLAKEYVLDIDLPWIVVATSNFPQLDVLLLEAAALAAKAINGVLIHCPHYERGVGAADQWMAKYRKWHCVTVRNYRTLDVVPLADMLVVSGSTVGQEACHLSVPILQYAGSRAILDSEVLVKLGASFPITLSTAADGARRIIADESLRQSLAVGRKRVLTDLFSYEQSNYFNNNIKRIL